MNVANKIKFFNNTHDKLITIHNYGIRVWTVDLVAKKIAFHDISKDIKDVQKGKSGMNGKKYFISWNQG